MTQQLSPETEDVLGGSPPAQPRASAPRSCRILLVEDNPVNQRVGRAMLEKLGFHVDIVADGAEAVSAATLTPYGAVLMDCQIPVLDGYEATREIRRVQGASRRTPIIAVTAWATRSDHQRCLTAGMDDYLTKPLSLQTLADVLRRWAPEAAQAAGDDDPGAILATAGRPHGTEPGPPVLDAEIVARLTRLGESAGLDLLGQLAVIFASDSGSRVIALHAELSAGDAVAVGRSAHALRGAGANLGATELARLCAVLERDGAAGDLARGAGLLAAIEAELALVRDALGSWTSPA